MKKETVKPIYSVEASIWDGTIQLPGVLRLLNNSVVFKFKVFKKSHLNLQIPLNEIKAIDEFLLYELSRGGLRIENINGHFDLFVLENASLFRQKVIQELSVVE